MNQRLQLRRISVTEIGRRRVTLEHPGRDQVDLFVGGLGGQHRRHQKLERGGEVKGAQLLGRARVLAGQAAGRLPGTPFWGSWSGHGLQGRDPLARVRRRCDGG